MTTTNVKWPKKAKCPTCSEDVLQVPNRRGSTVLVEEAPVMSRFYDTVTRRPVWDLCAERGGFYPLHKCRGSRAGKGKRVAEAVAALLFAVAPAMAQQVTLENPAPIHRTEWARVVVPSDLVGDDADGWTLGGMPVVFGQQVGDGGRLAHVWCTLGAGERWTGTMQRAKPDVLPTAPSLGPARVEPDPQLGVTLTVAGVPWRPRVLEVEQDGPSAVVHVRGRIPATQLVSDLWVHAYPGQSHAWWELLVVASDPTVPATYAEIPELVLSAVAGVVPMVLWSEWRGVERLDASTVRLLGSTTFGDTQGQAWCGSLALAADPAAGAAAYGPIVGMVDPEEWSGRLGPFGVTPAAVRVDRGAYGDALAAWSAQVSRYAGTPWAKGGLGLNPNSGDTGSQHDFGACKLGPAFAVPGGGPLHVLRALHSALQEACRPGQFREADGSPWLPWDHPAHVTWTGYTHWHPSVSTDRAGKGSAPTPRFSGGWIGPDRQHWSNNVLCGAYLQTGSRALRAIIERQAMQVLSGETVDRRFTTSGAGAPRGIGRTLLAASWIDCCLREGKLRTLMRQRVADRLRLIIEPATRPSAAAEIAPLGHVVDPRVLQGTDAWRPWEEALGAIGLRAAELRFGSDVAGVVLRRQLATLLRHGWWHDGQRWLMAEAVAYANGRALEPSAYPRAGSGAQPSPLVERNLGFEAWGLPAVVIGAAVFDGELAARAEAILAEWPTRTVSDAEWRAVR